MARSPTLKPSPTTFRMARSLLSPRAVQASEDETVVFAWITYPSREKRDEINAQVMQDPRMKMDDWKGIFDTQRMIYGGFEVIVGS